MKLIARKHLNLTDYLSRNPFSKPEPIENYDEEYVINGECVIPLLEFNKTHGSITNEKRMAMQTDKAEAHASNNQSQTRSANELSTNERNKHWPLQITQSVHKVRHTTAENNQTVENKMDIIIIESIEKDDPSEDNIRLTTRWKEIVKPGDYRFTQGQWRKYAPSRALRSEQNRIEVELRPKRNKLLWKRIERNSRRRIRVKTRIP